MTKQLQSAIEAVKTQNIYLKSWSIWQLLTNSVQSIFTSTLVSLWNVSGSLSVLASEDTCTLSCAILVLLDTCLSELAVGLLVFLSGLYFAGGILYAFM